jgi:hypothetical protein
MKVATGAVVDGRVVVEGANLAEGSTVTVLLRERRVSIGMRQRTERNYSAIAVGRFA